MESAVKATHLPVIRRLPEAAINQIAAGEVIERPASVVKELVENAIDAGASHILIQAFNGGISKLIIEDDGHGMGPEELELATERHATSKLTDTSEGRIDLLNVSYLGFRGEALPSIGSVARLNITSRAKGGNDAFSLMIEGGEKGTVKPAAWAGKASHGTRLEVTDLFYATPARLKFLKSERAEAMAIADIVKRMAIANPKVGFELVMDGRSRFALQPVLLDLEDDLARLGKLLPKDFDKNAIKIDAARDTIKISGFAGVPTFNRGNSLEQYLFVNGRPVKDKLLHGVMRAAYADFLARDRHAVAVLFVDVPPELVDVNVHPAKAEVRFREAGKVRATLISAIKTALIDSGHKASTTIAEFALNRARQETVQPILSPGAYEDGVTQSSGYRYQQDYSQRSVRAPGAPSDFEVEARIYGQDGGQDAFAASSAEVPSNGEETDFPPLGLARAQLHETYIVSQTEDGFILVDQHAAHERLVYEKMKQARAKGEIDRQTLLIPELIELGEKAAQNILNYAADLLEIGLEVESFGAGTVCVRATPSILGALDVKGLIEDIADEIEDLGQSETLKTRIDNLLGDMACRTSVRAGRRLQISEMNALLRQMEATPHSGQCNHGRPTYVELKLGDVERLFGRR